MPSSAGLGSLDPNVFPLDAIELQEESASSKIIAGRDEWRFGSAISGSEWVTGRTYKAGDIVWNPVDKLTYVALVDNASIEPDYSDSGVEGVTWEWIAGSISGFVSGRGWWLKLPDGTMIQRHSFTVSRSTLVNTNIGTYGWSYYVSAGTTWTFPVPFIDAVVDVVQRGQNTGFISCADPTADSVSASSVGPVSGTTSVTLIAIGRWKA